MQLVFSYLPQMYEVNPAPSICAYPHISAGTLALHGADVRTSADASNVGAAAAELLLADMNAGVDRLLKLSICMEP